MQEREQQRIREEEEEQKIALENQNPPERVKKLICSLVLESRQLYPKELEFVKMHIEKPAIRQQFSEFLNAFQTPRNVRNEKCLETLGEIIVLIIGVLQEEKDNQNLKELISIIHASQLLFTFREDSGPGGRLIKVFLNSYISEHEIW